MVDHDEAGAGRVVAVNVSGDEGASYGTALSPFAERLYPESEQHRCNCSARGSGRVR